MCKAKIGHIQNCVENLVHPENTYCLFKNYLSPAGTREGTESTEGITASFHDLTLTLKNVSSKRDGRRNHLFDLNCCFACLCELKFVASDLHLNKYTLGIYKCSLELLGWVDKFG